MQVIPGSNPRWNAITVIRDSITMQFSLVLNLLVPNRLSIRGCHSITVNTIYWVEDDICLRYTQFWFLCRRKWTLMVPSPIYREEWCAPSSLTSALKMDLYYIPKICTCVNVFCFDYVTNSTRAPPQYKDSLSRYGNPMLKIRRSQDRLIFNIGIIYW